MRALTRLAMLTAVGALFLALLPDSALANHVQCGDVIAKDTTLDGDLSCRGDGLTVVASGVTVDLAGHTIAGSGTDEGVSVWAGDVTITGGTITDFAYGAYTDGPRGTTLHDVVLRRNGTGLHCQFAPECRIEQSVVRDNGVGIRIYSPDGGDPEPTVIRRNEIVLNVTGVRTTGESALVAHNRVAQNSGDGISSSFGRPVGVVRNLVSGNGEEGVRIFFGVQATISGNRIVDNAANGVGVHGGSGEGTEADIDNNRIERNGGDGVLVEPFTNVTVRHNRANRNGDDGIDVDIPTCCQDETLVAANMAHFNADLGIEAGPGTTDGGGNKARHNGNPAQCTGVSCR